MNQYIRLTLGVVLFAAALVMHSLVVLAADGVDLLPDFDLEGHNVSSSVSSITTQMNNKLPNPGNFLGIAKSKPDIENFAFKGRNFDCYVYKHMMNHESQLKQYRNELDSRGFYSYPDEVSGESALVIENSDKTRAAYLFINYRRRGQFMFMLENGFEMDDAVVKAVTLDKGDVILTLNGLVYEYEDQSMKSGKLEWEDWKYQLFTRGLGASLMDILPYGVPDYGEYYIPVKHEENVLMATITLDEGDIVLALPRNMKTGDKKQYTHDSALDLGVRLSLFGKIYYSKQVTVRTENYGGYYRYNKLAVDNLITGNKDYLNVKVIYRDDREIKGSMEGVFDAGKTKVNVEFWLPLV